MRTCAPLVVLGLCPKLKYPPLCGVIVIASETAAWWIRMAKLTKYEKETIILFSEGEDTAHISQRESCSVSG